MGDEFKYGGGVEGDKGVPCASECIAENSVIPWCPTINDFDREWWKPGKDGKGTWGYCDIGKKRKGGKRKDRKGGRKKYLEGRILGKYISKTY